MKCSTILPTRMQSIYNTQDDYDANYPEDDDWDQEYEDWLDYQDWLTQSWD